jgi:hypothetical protein
MNNRDFEEIKDYVDEILAYLDIYYDDITVKQLIEDLESIEPERRKYITGYGTLVCALRS